VPFLILEKMTSYGIIRSDNMPWMKPTKTKKIKIVNPIFEQCIELTNDPYWKTIFTNAMLGKLPSGFSYSDGNLVYKKGNKLIKTLLSGNPINILTTSLDFFRTNGGLYSDIDRERELINANAGMTFQQMTWAQICKNSILKRLLIHAYLKKLAKSDAEYKNLKTIVNIGMIVGIITNSDIEYRNGEITNIPNIVYREGIWMLEDNGKRKKVINAKIKHKNKNDYLSSWKKYLGIDKDTTIAETEELDC